MRLKTTSQAFIKVYDRKQPYTWICLQHKVGLKDYRVYSDSDVRMSELFIRYLQTEPVYHGVLNFIFHDSLGFPYRNISMRFSEMLTYINQKL